MLLKRFVAASPPLLFALFVAKLQLTGTLAYYINSRTVWIVLAGAFLFALVGAASMRRAFRSDVRTHMSWQTFVFLLPAVIGLVLPARPLSAATGQAQSFGTLQLASHVSNGSPGDRFPEWVANITNHPDAAWWAGQHATLVGFVSRQVNLPPRSFIVARFVVTCCVVDAVLLGFPAQMDTGPLPADGSWIQVSGAFGARYWTDPHGSQWPVLQHARLSSVKIPSNPYLSP